MRQRLQGTHRIIVCAPLLAAVAGFATSAFSQNAPAPSSVAPATLSTNTSAATVPSMNDAPVIVDSGSEPLRVLVPNIHHKKKKTAGKAKGKANGGVSSHESSSGVYVVQPEADSTGGIAELFREAWQNGVMLARSSGEFITRSLFKPDIPFKPIPDEWALAPVVEPTAPLASATEMAALTPAAGQNDAVMIPPSGPAAPPPAAPAVEPNPEAAIREYIPPATAATVSAPVVLSSAQDRSEPAPTLSERSKAIAAKLKPQPDHPAEQPFTTPVNIDRAREISVLANAEPSAGKMPGIETATRRTGAMDANYELERAYNALMAGESQNAISLYQDVLSINPRNKDALFGLATTYHRAGQLDMARALYGKLLEIDPRHRDGLNNFLVLLAEEAPQEALAQMTKLEAQNPDFSPIPAQMAIINQRLGNNGQAIDKMYRALSISPENLTYRYNLAILLDKDGRREQAATLYSQLLNAHMKGAPIPGDPAKLQQRLTFIRSNVR